VYSGDASAGGEYRKGQNRKIRYEKSEKEGQGPVAKGVGPGWADLFGGGSEV